jgi:3-dehydroquinate dehydratase/shikimate dehydrogenase
MERVVIIVSITGPTMSDALTQVASSDRSADAFEFRLDLIRAPAIATLMLSTAKPIVATCRPAWEGGGFRGSEAARVEILSSASLLGADYVDIEMGTSGRFLSGFLARRRETGVILSRHLPKGARVNVRGVYRTMTRFDADVLKFAFHATDAWQNALAWEFLALAGKERRKAIAIAMGDAGEPTRVLYRVFGGWATYASSEEGNPAAPGQVSARMLKDVYRADRRKRTTRIFGVIGNPVGQSKGIFVHNALFARAGKNAIYCRFVVADLGRFMKRVAPLLKGFSVTIPHKASVMKYLQAIDGRAKAIGAVNTVLHRRGGWWGTNTDAPGALDAIEKRTSVAGKTILLLGAGGAARAIAYEARKRGAVVLVANRTEKRARRLAFDLHIQHIEMKEIRSVVFDILVNATTIGMVPNIACSPAPASMLQGKLVFDVVYNPPVTELLRAATAVGAQTIEGTEMYINQAARQFRLYAGIAPDLDAMKEILSQRS